MAGHIIYGMPGGSAIIETHVGETLGGITAFSTYEEAEIAGLSMLDDQPNQALRSAEEAGRAERAAQNPYAKYQNMSYPRLLFEAIKSIRFGKP